MCCIILHLYIFHSPGSEPGVGQGCGVPHRDGGGEDTLDGGTAPVASCWLGWGGVPAAVDSWGEWY